MKNERPPVLAGLRLADLLQGAVIAPYLVQELVAARAVPVVFVPQGVLLVVVLMVVLGPVELPVAGRISVTIGALNTPEQPPRS